MSNYRARRHFLEDCCEIVPGVPLLPTLPVAMSYSYSIGGVHYVFLRRFLRDSCLSLHADGGESWLRFLLHSNCVACGCFYLQAFPQEPTMVLKTPHWLLCVQYIIFRSVWCTCQTPKPKVLTHLLTFSCGCLAITTVCVFLEIFYFAHSQYLWQCAWADLSASPRVHHTRVLNLSSGAEALSGDALGAFWTLWAGGLWRSEKPPDIQYVTQTGVMTPEAGWIRPGWLAHSGATSG